MAKPGPQAPFIPKAPQAACLMYLKNFRHHTSASHIPQLNWSCFKPKFSGKLEEDAEAHLLRTNDWMDTYRFRRTIRFKDFL